MLVQTWFSLIHTGLGRTNPSGRGPASGMKKGSVEALLCQYALQACSTHHATLMCCSLVVLRNCFAAGTNGCCDLNHHGYLPGSVTCGKAGGLVPDSGNGETAWPAFGEAQQVVQ